ncbi:hypothetical protein [uncultured Ilyobacter sp.]|uniref:dCTP deaminase n=1 Tax=uncultured Ilyobacter sp. TaxID=544433 RepID=UPI0029C93DCF|nr:hypothetical protein [uncultured Ilyobacter sp.]
MKLTGQEIKTRCLENGLIENYTEDSIGSISCDLRIENIILAADEKKDVDEHYLKPGEVVFVGTMENIKLPNDLIGIVYGKNSRIRLGLEIAAPIYQPGHYTKIFIRVQNVSSNEIQLKKGHQIAQILFETTNTVEAPYDGTFKDELVYRGLGKYDSEYKVKAIRKQMDTLENLESKLYGVVAALMAVFVTIVSVINSNSSGTRSGVDFIFTNLLTISVTAALFGIISMFIPKGTKNINKPTTYCLTISFLCFAVALLIHYKF